MTAREQKYIKTQRRDIAIRKLLNKKRVHLGVEYKLHYLIMGRWLIENHAWHRRRTTGFSVMDMGPKPPKRFWKYGRWMYI